MLIDVLRVRQFRLFSSGFVVSQLARWMQVFGLGILVVQAAQHAGAPSDIPLYLGLMGIASAVPGLVLTLFAGAVADRYDRRRLLMVTQGVMATNAALLALMSWSGSVTIPILLAAAAIQAAAFAFDAPSRHAMVPRLVPHTLVPAAVGLQAAATTGAQMIGPLLGGLLIVPFGTTGLFAANALGFGTIILALGAMSPIAVSAGRDGGLVGTIVEGLAYIRRTAILRWILAISSTLLVVSGSFSLLLPAVAAGGANSGAGSLALLLSATGLGALVGSLLLSQIGRLAMLGRAFALATIASGVVLVAFGLVQDPVVRLVVAALVGTTLVLSGGTALNVLQFETADAFRGRVMSVWALMTVGLVPTGQFVLGFLGAAIGIDAALSVGGIVVLATGVYGAVRVAPLTSWRRPARELEVPPVVES